MDHRWALLTVYVVAVAVLAVWVVASAPASNPVVYGYDTDIEVSVDVVDGAVGVDIAEVSASGLPEVDLWLGGAPGLVLTAPRQVQIDNAGVTVSGMDELLAQAFSVTGDDPVVPADVPTFIQVVVEQFPAAGGPRTPATPVDSSIVVEMPLVADGAVIARISATLTAVPRTGEDLGIPGAMDIPDQRLPRPEVGEAIPTKLADGRPIWIVGLDDDVVVVDARSPHAASGLVGWCGSMPGFIDSIGASRFTARGEYRFGPALHDLRAYDVDVHHDHVVATGRLAPPSGVDHVGPDVVMPPIEGSPVEQQGPACNSDPAINEAADQAGYYLEDFRGDPTWVQHDLSDWPDLAGARGDGWFRTDQAHIDGIAHLVGDVLIERRRGHIVDVAAPPGVARFLYGSDISSQPQTVQLVQVELDVGAVAFRPVMWVTADGVEPAAADPEPPRHLVGTHPVLSYQLHPAATLDGEPGDLVDIVVTDGTVVSVTPTTATGRH